MPDRRREEVINTILATCIASRGTPADPETIHDGGRARPDVIASFRGLRCVLEGKVADVSNAKGIVLEDAKGRVEQGISQIAVALVYPEEFRDMDFSELPEALNATQFEFCVYTEAGAGEWHTGGLDAILSELRRAHDILVEDDVVKAAVDDLNLGLADVANNFISSAAICDRLIDVLGIGESDNGSNSN